VKRQSDHHSVPRSLPFAHHAAATIDIVLFPIVESNSELQQRWKIVFAMRKPSNR